VAAEDEAHAMRAEVDEFKIERCTRTVGEPTAVWVKRSSLRRSA
jgi:hypothetical protein